MNEKILAKINQISSWVLAIIIFLYILSGYGVVKGIMNPVLAKRIHEQWLAIPLFLSFVVHLVISSRWALVRWKVFGDIKSASVYVLIFSAALFIFFLWLHFT